MGNIQTAGQCHSHGHGRYPSTIYKGLTDGIQDNKTGIAEYRYGNNPSHKLNSQLRMIFSNQMNHHIRKLQSGSRFFQNGSDQSSQDNHDTDARKGSRESGSDHVG